MEHEVPGCGHDLAEVVRCHGGRHAYGDTGGAVDQKCGQPRGQDGRLQLASVVVGDEIDHVLVEGFGHGQGRGCQAALGVAHGRRAVVGGAEVAVAIDEGQAQGEGLGQAHERVVDRRVAVGMEPTHDISDHPGALDVASIGAQTHLVHLEEDAALHGLEAIASIGERTGVDDGVGVLEEGRPHLAVDIDVDDAIDGFTLACHAESLRATALRGHGTRRDPRGESERFLDVGPACP